MVIIWPKPHEKGSDMLNILEAARSAYYLSDNGSQLLAAVI